MLTVRLGLSLRCGLLTTFVLLATLRSAQSFGQDLPNPFPTASSPIGQATVWTFPDDTKSWRAVRDCKLTANNDVTTVRSSGVDPILVRAIKPIDQPFEFKLTCRASAATSAQLFWDQSGKDRFNEKDSRRFEIVGDGRWHEYSVKVDQPNVRSLRLDPANSPCEVELQQIQLQPYRPAEFEITSIAWVEADQLRVQLRSSTTTPQSISITSQITSSTNTQSIEATTIELPAAGDASVTLRIPMVSEGADSIVVTAASSNTKCLRPCIRANIAQRLLATNKHDQLLKSWVSVANDQISLSLAADGSAAVIRMRTENAAPWRVAGFLAPLAWDRNSLERYSVQSDGTTISAESQNSKLQFVLDKNKVQIVRSSQQSLEGPVVLVPGSIEQALLAGVEHLGRLEQSSSSIDINTEDRFRFEPPPHHLTMQLASVVTEASSLSLRWSDPNLQPVFATPNFFDGTQDSRIALKAQQLSAVLVVDNGWASGGRIEDGILEYIQGNGLMPLPEPARSAKQQDELDWAGLSQSELMDKNNGWFHAIQPGSHGMPKNAAWFGDHASAVLALNKPLPVDAGKLVRGGSHLANDRWMFLTGTAEQWLTSQKQLLQAGLSRQQADGSVLYDGQWSVGHFEKTSSGQCGMLAEQLMKIALMTGDKQALEAGLKTLEFCKRFRTPRGAQVWECPLHAPDIMASAHLLRAYTIAFQLTGNHEYKNLAVRWALRGLPFVYQWQGEGSWNAMPYSTIATLCATHRVAPLWIGRPVQWCGIVYADALLDLSQFDKSLDWIKIADGIYRSACYQQYATGPNVGLLPDSVLPTTERRFPLDINPATLVLLGHRLRSLPVQLDCQLIDGQHVVSPWPIILEKDRITFQSPKDAAEFEVVIDGVVRRTTHGEVLHRPLK